MAGFRKADIERAVEHLHSIPEMSPVVDRIGPFTLRATRDRFSLLIRSIVSQQISTLAARTVRKRLEAVLPDGAITAENILSLSEEQLKGVGLSGQKKKYIRLIAEEVATGRVNLQELGSKTNEEVSEILCSIKGVGPWTAQMFLMFGLARLDILPPLDIGVQEGVRFIYDLPTRPTPNELEKIAQPWSPFSTVATWYVWRDLETRQGLIDKRASSEYPV